MSVQSVALASLTATYTDSEGEDAPAGDDSHDNSNTPKGAAPDNNRRQASDSPRSNERTSSSNSPVANFRPTLVTDVTSRVQRLVSYFDDTVVSDEEGTAILPPRPLDGGAQPALNGRGIQPMDRSPERSSDLPSDEEEDPYGVVIPPDPAGTCPQELQDKISALYRKTEAGLDMNRHIQQRKDFRNPSIYEKLIQYCNINELGTNYPADRFDPFRWNKESYYEELAKTQKTEMERLEKARKEKSGAKIEIVSGTAKRANAATTALLASSAEEEAKKRKSKWDQINTNIALVAGTTTTATTSASATGVVAATTVKQGVVVQTSVSASASSSTKTVISAFGSLPKKRL